jgi:cobalamin biosynthesis Mg chelatase CobN
VADGATGTSDPLFVFTNQTHATKCTYSLSEHSVAGFTAVFTPASPVDLPFNNASTGNDRKVDLTNTAEVTTSTAPPTSSTPASPAPSTSTSTSSSSASATQTIINDSGLAPSPSATPIANTGPREQVRASVYIGVALCLLGLVLLFAGSWSRRRGQHTG